MENASKALLMAAGVLIGILILSLAVYLFATFGASSAELHKQNEQNQLNQFNSQFTSYEGKDDVTIYDVITVANLATENNRNYNFVGRNAIAESTDYYIYVVFDGDNIEYGQDANSSTITDTYNNIIKSEELKNVTDEDGITYKKLPTYSCKAEINSTTGRVWKVTFSES